jgi:hypothetical protein
MLLLLRILLSFKSLAHAESSCGEHRAEVKGERLTVCLPGLHCPSACLAAGMGIGVGDSSEGPAGWNFEHVPATPQPLPGAAPIGTASSVSSAASSSTPYTPAPLFADLHQRPGPAALALPGLRNETGEYNCFLNVIIQCL